MLFHRNTAAQVFDARLAAGNSDPSGLALMSLAYDFIIPGMSVYGEFFSKGISADYDANRDYFTEMDPPNSIIGSPLSKLIWGSATDTHGATWPTALIPDEFRHVQPSDVKTLLISGNVDFSTPAEFATRELLPVLSNGKQVVLSEMGHVNYVMTLQPKAIEHLMTHYYDTGKVDDSLFIYKPMGFKVKLGFPTIAKLSLGGAIVFIIAIFGALRTILKRAHRKQEKN